MKTYILSKLAGAHLSQHPGDYCTNQKIDIKIVSVYPFINNHFFREIESHSLYWFVRVLFNTNSIYGVCLKIMLWEPRLLYIVVIWNGKSIQWRIL